MAYAYNGLNFNFAVLVTQGPCIESAGPRCCPSGCCAYSWNIYAANYGCTSARVAGLSGGENGTATIDEGEEWDPASVSPTADVVIRTKAAKPFSV